MRKIMNRSGFAVSGIIYTLLILFIILIIAILTMFNSRKTTLDKLKEKVLNQIGSNAVVKDSVYNPVSQIVEHKILAKGYYKIELTSSNGSILTTELYLKEGEILYLKVGSKTFNNGNTEIYSDKGLSSLLLRATNTDFIAESKYYDRNLLKTTYVNKKLVEANGKILISYIQRERKNNDLNQVRYIKNCIDENNIDNANKWNEISAIYKGVNVAVGKSVKLYNLVGNQLIEQSGDYNSIIDNNLTTFSTISNGENCAIVDLGRTYPLDYIYTWHEYGQEKTYYNDNIYISSAGIDYKPIYNYEVKENKTGIEISAYEIPKVKLIDNMYVPVKQFDNATWLRIYHHNNLSGTILWDAKAQLLSDIGYDSIHKKSILYSLSNFIKNGKYELLLEYPDLSMQKYNRWIQTSNFTTATQVSGYSAVHTDYVTMNFGGLLLSNSANTIISSIDNIHYAIGTINGVGGINGYDSNLITGTTDLWVRIYD